MNKKTLDFPDLPDHIQTKIEQDRDRNRDSLMDGLRAGLIDEDFATASGCRQFGEYAFKVIARYRDKANQGSHIDQRIVLAEMAAELFEAFDDRVDEYLDGKSP